MTDLNPFHNSVLHIALDIHQALHAYLRTLNPIREFIYLLAGIFRSAWYGDGYYGFGIIKYGKAGSFSSKWRVAKL